MCVYEKGECEVPDLCSERWSVRRGLGQPVRRVRLSVLGASLLLGAPGDVVWPRGRVVLIDELLHDLPGGVQLVEVLLEDVLLPELLQEGLPLPQLVVLATGPLKELEACGRQGSKRT